MIVYTKSCLPCSHKRSWRELREYARENGLDIEQRRVDRNSDWRAEAEQYEIELPFIVSGGVALKLGEPLGRLS